MRLSAPPVCHAAVRSPKTEKITASRHETLACWHGWSCMGEGLFYHDALEVIEIVNPVARFVIPTADAEGDFNQRLRLEHRAGVWRVRILGVLNQFREGHGHDARGGVSFLWH